MLLLGQPAQAVATTAWYQLRPMLKRAALKLPTQQIGVGWQVHKQRPDGQHDRQGLVSVTFHLRSELAVPLGACVDMMSKQLMQRAMKAPAPAPAVKTPGAKLTW